MYLITILLNFLSCFIIHLYIVKNTQYLRKCWYPLLLQFDKKLRILIKRKLKIMDPLKKHKSIKARYNEFYENLPSLNLSLDSLKIHQKKLNLNYDIMVLNPNSNLNVGTIYRSGTLLGLNKFIIAGKKIYTPLSMVGYNYVPIEYLNLFPKMRNRYDETSLTDYYYKILFDFIITNDYLPIIIEQGGDNILNTNTYKLSQEQKLLFIFGNEKYGIPKNMIYQLKKLGGIEISIPQWGCGHSYNLSQSANIIMWEHYRNFYSSNLIK